MEIENGRRVRIRYHCRTLDGKIFTPEKTETVDFQVGAGTMPPSIEAGLKGSRAGDHRTIRVPASELHLFPFPKEVKPIGKTRVKVAYDFGPGEGGDVAVISSPPGKNDLEAPPSGVDVDFEVEVVAVE